jgi:predicted amidophosphoribosyltransferase
MKCPQCGSDVGLNPFSICGVCGAVLSHEKEEDGKTVSEKVSGK